jgi:sec-independent protein translocase protein TatA
MFPSLGLPELALVLVIVLLVFGPGKLPQVAKSLGEALQQFKKAASGTPTEPPPAAPTPTTAPPAEKTTEHEG